jgi:hypothetical protein
MLKFTSIQRGITYSATKVFNKLPLDIIQFQHDKRQFKTALKKSIYLHIFFNSVDEFLAFR